MTLMGSIGPAGEMRVTIGLREWAPLTVWWTRPEAQWRTPGMPRIYQRHLHAYAQWIGLRGSTIGLTDAGEPILATDDQVILNEVPDLIRFRDHVVAWHGTDRLRATWTDRGTIALWSPGELIGPLTIKAGSTFPINAPVMRVLWDFDEYTTTVECIPVAPDLQTLA